MLSSRTFIFLFFVLTALVSVSSADGFFFWLRADGDTEDGKGGNDGSGDSGNGGGLGSALSSVLGNGGGAAAASTTASAAASTTDTSSSSSSDSSTPSKTPKSTPTTDSSSSSTSDSSSETPSTTPITLTNSKGTPSTTFVVVETSVVSGSKIVSITHPASSPSAAATGGLASNDNSGTSDSSMSQNTKNIAIGVGVGIGGAILLGGLAIAAWRIWGRHKHTPEEDHFLMNDSISEKPASNPSASPFKSTLDQYHNPAGRLNTASNF